MGTAYHRTEEVKTPESRRYYGVSYTTPINAAKELVPVIDLADRLCGPGGLKRSGSEWVGCCPLPDHQDINPSFSVSKEKNVWWCFGCLRGGSVIELARLAWGYDEREAPMAAADLLNEYGYVVPQRPPSWYRKQERQKPVRDAIEKTRNNIYRRRLFKALILPHINMIDDEAERYQELDRAWSDFQRFMP